MTLPHCDQLAERNADQHRNSCNMAKAELRKDWRKISIQELDKMRRKDFENKENKAQPARKLARLAVALAEEEQAEEEQPAADIPAASAAVVHIAVASAADIASGDNNPEKLSLRYQKYPRLDDFPIQIPIYRKDAGSDSFRCKTRGIAEKTAHNFFYKSDLRS